ncbi:MAG TPA: hypothetical protein VFR85_04205 [Anaeromyxobacteraceae bacterium]|nr:hypothetical protein [Anaeromyxobacteraceae bacterium]
MVLVLALAACGPLTPGERAAEQGLSAQNGLSPNGLSQNGLSQNGLSQNGLSQNGLSQNGLSQNGLGTDFTTWFNHDAATSDVVMRYLVRCAVPAGESRTWKDPVTNVTYTWPGALGLAPGWASGSAATTAEQQVITACLAAHVNKYGVNVSISVQGRSSTGTAVPLEANELTTYLVREACFFGNLFRDEGVFVGLDHSPWSSKYSSARACAFDYAYGASPDCAPIQVAGDCSALCALDAGGTYYTSCTYNGKTYKPVTTRLRSQDIYRCGDGNCQFTESCGWGYDWDSCRSDCGRCW